MNIRKRSISIVVVCCMAFQLVFAGLPIFGGQADASANTMVNLITNGGFEEGGLIPDKGWQDGGRPAGWGVWRAMEGNQNVSVTEAVYHTGTRSIQVKHDKLARTDIVPDPLVPITPGQTYKLQAWLKTDQVLPENVSKGVYIRTQYCGADGKKIEDGPYLPYVRGTTDWTPYELLLQVPDKAQIASFKVEIFFETGTGTLWIDDVTLSPFKDITSIELNPKNVNMDKEKKVQLIPTVTPANAPIDDLIWSSSNTSVATVQNGEVTAHDYGTAVISATTSDHKVSAQSFVTVESEAQKKAYETLRKKWATKLVGGEGIDMNDPELAANVEALVNRMTNKEGTGRWDTLNKTADPDTLWEGVISKTQNDSWRISWAYGIIRDLSLAYSMKGSSLYQNEDLKNDIIHAMEWMLKYQYNSSKKITGNWWDWEIGTPQEIMNILSLMYDAMPPELIGKYIEAVDKFVPDPKKRVANSATIETGANLLDKALVVMLRGIVGQHAAKVMQGRDSIADEFLYVKKGDGLYEDGSLVQHTSIAYTGGYGAVLLGRMADLFYIFVDSEWAITDPNANHVYSWVKDSFEPLLYKGAILDSVKGRSISRAADSDHITGRTIIMTLLRLAQSAPPAIAEQTKSMVKEWVLSDTTFEHYYKGLPLYELHLLKQLMQDDSVAPRGELVHTQMFAGMDRAVQLRPDFGLSISMFSDRIAAFEYGNGENKKGWYTGIGMTNVYNSDLKQFSDHYWPTIDSYRLPGTTTDHSYKDPAEWGNYMNGKDWVGGSVIDDYYGAVGMEFSLAGSTGSSLQGKKSWFLFDDEMVAVGSDIANNTANMTETIVENRQLTQAGANKLIVNGHEMPTNLGWQEQMTDVKWAHMEGNAAGSDIGYVFPSGEKVTGKREAREGAWSEINKGGPTDLVKRNYLSLAIEHGKLPTAGTYEYVLLPGKTPEQTAAYEASPDIQVLAKTERVHAVKETKQQVTGLNFWEASAFQYVKTDKPISMMIKEKGNELTIAIAEPTQKQALVTVDLGKIGLHIVAQDPSIQVVQTFPYTRLAINTQGAAGKVHTITLKVDPSQTIDMEGMQPEEGEINKIPVMEDTFVRNGANHVNVNNGSKDYVEVREYGEGYTQRSFMKFDLSSLAGDIESVKLKVYGKINDGDAKYDSNLIGVHHVEDDSWKETEMVWGNQPAYGDAISTISFQKVDKWREYELTDTVKAELLHDQRLSVALIEQPGVKGLNTQIKSKENAALAPYLEVTTKASEGAKVTEVIVTPSTATIKQGEQVKLEATAKPDHAKNKQIVWTMSNEHRALASLQVINGQAVVTGVLPGKVEVIAASVDGGSQATVTIVIEGEEVKPDPTPSPTPGQSGPNGSKMKDQVQGMLGGQLKIDSTDEQLAAGQILISISNGAKSVQLSSAAITKLMEWNSEATLVLSVKNVSITLPLKQIANLEAANGVRIGMEPIAEAMVATIAGHVKGLGASLVTIADQVEMESGTLQPMYGSLIEAGKLEMKWMIETKANPEHLAGMRYDEDRKALVPVPMKLKAVGSGVEATFGGMPGETYLLVEANKTFTDLEKHWVKNDAQYLASKFIMQGRNTDSFVPQADITRAEMAALIVRMLDLGLKGSDLTYTDASGMQGKWYENDIIRVHEAGIMTGYADGSFKPEQTITRQEMAVMIARVMSKIQPDWMSGIEASQVDIFTDSKDIAAWSVKEVAAAVESGLLQGDKQKRFAPAAIATRAEAAAVVKRILDQINR
jgi:hyaluronate lyase